MPLKCGVKFRAEGWKTHDYLVVGSEKEKNQQIENRKDRTNKDTLRWETIEFFVIHKNYLTINPSVDSFKEQKITKQKFENKPK